MESQSQNPEFRNNPENFHPCCLKWPLKKNTKNWFSILHDYRLMLKNKISLQLNLS